MAAMSVTKTVSTYMKKYQNWSTPSYTCDINDNNLVLLYADTGEPVKHYTRGRRNERRLKLCRVAKQILPDPSKCAWSIDLFPTDVSRNHSNRKFAIRLQWPCGTSVTTSSFIVRSKSPEIAKARSILKRMRHSNPFSPYASAGELAFASPLGTLASPGGLPSPANGVATTNLMPTVVRLSKETDSDVETVPITLSGEAGTRLRKSLQSGTGGYLVHFPTTESAKPFLEHLRRSQSSTSTVDPTEILAINANLKSHVEQLQKLVLNLAKNETQQEQTMEALRRQLQHRHAAATTTTSHGVVAPPKVSSPRVASRNARLKLPLNAVPGQQLRFSCDGKCYRIRVPDNATPGSVLTVTVPANSNDTPTAFPAAHRVPGVAPPQPPSQRTSAAASPSTSRPPVLKPNQQLTLPNRVVARAPPQPVRNAKGDIRVVGSKSSPISSVKLSTQNAKPSSTTGVVTTTSPSAVLTKEPTQAATLPPPKTENVAKEPTTSDSTAEKKQPVILKKCADPPTVSGNESGKKCDKRPSPSSTKDTSDTPVSTVELPPTKRQKLQKTDQP